MIQEERRRGSGIRTAFEVLNAHPPLEGIARLRDLSTHGACIEDTSARPEIGKTVQLSVRVSEREPPRVLTGKVVRHTESGFAVEFDKPEPHFDSLIGEELAAEAPIENPRPSGQEPAMTRAGLSPFREVAVHCCANEQWISGRVCMHPSRPLLDHLNQREAFVRVLDAVVSHHHPDPMAFLALRTDAVDLVVPLESVDAVNEIRVGRIAERPVKCFLPYAVIEGTIGVIGKIRVSDHLLRCNAFIAIRDCQIRLANAESAPRDLSHVPVALVNVTRVIGISDLGASTPPPEDPGPSAR